MRTISAADEAILAGAPKFSMRMQVKDSGGTWRDLTTYGGVNVVQQLHWREDIDSPGVVWDATLKRELDKLSLAPLMESSPFNKGFNHATAYAALIAGNREVKFEWALQAEDDPGAKSWNLAVHGYIDLPETGNVVKVTGRGLQAPIVKKYVERERLYAYAQGANATKGVSIWPDANTGNTYRTFAVGDLVVPTEAKLNGHFYKATSITTGIVGATEPVWPVGGGSTVVDGGVTWTESGSTSTSAGTPVETVMQQLLDDNGLGTVSLWVPSSPSYNVRWFQVDRQPLFDELRALADSFGWCLRYVYDSGSSAFRLKLYDPGRSSTTSLRTFTKAQLRDVSKVAVDKTNIRNAVRVVYSDSQDPTASGIAKRKAVEVTDSTSITENGRMFCEIGEGSSSNVDTSSEATTLANAVLSDLKDPIATIAAQVTLFPFVELQDIYTLAADQVHFDVDQKLAVTGYDNNFEAGNVTTSLDLRGKPASGYLTWLQRTTDFSGEGAGRGGRGAGAGGGGGLDAVHSLTLLSAGSSFAITLDPSTLTAIGGVKGFITRDPHKTARQVDYEVHLSTSSSFTPSSSTLKAKSNGQEFETGALQPGTVYYLQVVPIVWNSEKPVRGSPSVEVSFTAGYCEPGHLNPETVRGPLPPNGGFEGWTQSGDTAPPSHWSVAVGAWDREVEKTTTARTGAAALDFTTDTSTAVKVRSAYFPVSELLTYAVGVWVQKHGTIEAGDNVDVGIEWYDGAKASISTSSFTTDVNDLPASWWKLSRNYVAPATAQFARVFIKKSSALNYQLRIDDFEVLVSDDLWHTVGGSGEPGFSNSWVAHTGGTNDPQFRQVGNYGEMRGAAKNGSSATAAIFTLPANLRPTRAIEGLPIASNGAYGELTISTGGVVAAAVGNTTKLCLDGVRWPLD